MDILELIKKHYPYCVGAMITGSHSELHVADKFSDIDVVIFDPSFSVVSARNVKINQIDIDFTQVPL